MSTVFASDPQITCSPPDRWGPVNFDGVDGLGTYDPGATATYTFNGTQVEVFGTQLNGSQVNFVVDSQNFPRNYQNTPSSPNTILFSAAFQNNSEHTLVMVLESIHGGILLNSMVVSDFPSTPISSLATTSSGLTAPKPTLSQPGPSADTIEVAGSSSAASSIGRIVGGVAVEVVLLLVSIAAGVALLLLLIGVSFYIWRRKKRKRSPISAEPNLAPIPFRIEEFPAPLHEAERSPASVPTMTLSRASAIAGSLTILDTGSTNNNQEMSRSSSIYKEALDGGKTSAIREPQTAEPLGGDLESLRTTWSEAPPSYKS